MATGGSKYVDEGEFFGKPAPIKLSLIDEYIASPIKEYRASVCRVRGATTGTGFLANVDLDEDSMISGLFTCFHVLYFKELGVDKSAFIKTDFSGTNYMFQIEPLCVKNVEYDFIFNPIPVDFLKGYRDNGLRFSPIGDMVNFGDKIYSPVAEGGSGNMSGHKFSL